MSDSFDNSHPRCGLGRRPIHRPTQERKVTFPAPYPDEALIVSFQYYVRLVIRTSRLSLHCSLVHLLPCRFLHPDDIPLHCPHRLRFSTRRLVLLPIPHLQSIPERSTRQLYLDNKLLLTIGVRHLLNIESMVHRVPLDPSPEGQRGHRRRTLPFHHNI